MNNPWDGIQDGVAGFLLSHAVLATFFSSDMVNKNTNQIMWFGTALCGSLYLVWKMISNYNTGRKSSGDNHSLKSYQGEEESAVRLMDDIEESLDIETDIIHKNHSASTLGGNHRFGTKSPFWFTRIWPGFEEEAEEESKAEVDAKQCTLDEKKDVKPGTLSIDKENNDMNTFANNSLNSNSTFSHGQTSLIKKQTMKTYLIRFLVVTLSAATPYYLVFLSSWMFNAFGVVGLLFSLAEAIATLARCVYWLQLWIGQHRRVCPLWKLTPSFPDSEWPLCEVIIAHYQEPTDEIAGTLRAALDMDYPHDKFIVSILDDGYFKVVDGEYVVTAGGRDLEAMVIAMYSRLGDQNSKAEVKWVEMPERCGVPGCSDRGSRVLVMSKPYVPQVRVVCRRKAPDSYFKGGNLNNFIYNIASPYASFLSILDADMVPSEDFLQLSLPLYFSYSKGSDRQGGKGRWRCNWEVAMTASPQHYRNLETNGIQDDPLNQKNESYTRRLQQRMDACGLVHFCGTNTTFFIPAVRDAMGFVTGLLSEDTPTGLILSQLGWDSHFIDVALAVGTVKESASDTMMQRFRWMAGNGLLFLFGRNFGSQGFLKHGPAEARALRIARMQRNSHHYSLQSNDLITAAKHKKGSPSRKKFGDIDSCQFELSMPAQEENAFLSNQEIFRDVDITKKANGSPLDHQVESIDRYLIGVGEKDVGYEIRKGKANCWRRKICLWSVYDVGMSYMFVSTFWHLCYHALMFDSLIFSDGERPVTMQPLFGVLYSVGSFAIILVLGPANGVLRVVNEWFAWSWLKVIAAAHVLSIARSIPLDEDSSFDEDVLEEFEGNGSDSDKSEDVENINDRDDGESSKLLNRRKSTSHQDSNNLKDNMPHSNKTAGTDLAFKNNVSAYRQANKTPTAAPAGGGWNAASNLRVWLLIPPMIYYLFVAALLVKTILFGVNGQSILTDAIMRGTDGSDWLMPSVTLPQHLLGIFLGVLFLIHSWPTFKVSALEVVGLKMFQGECHGGAIFAAFLLIAPLLLILFANPDVDIGRIKPKQFGSIDSDLSSQRNAGLMFDWPIGAYDYNHLHPQPTPKWSLPLLAHQVTTSRTLPPSTHVVTTAAKPNHPLHHNISSFINQELTLTHNQRIYPKVNAHIMKMHQKKELLEEELSELDRDISPGSKQHSSSSSLFQDTPQLQRHGDTAMVYGDAGTMLSFTLDVSKVGCGCTTALYMVAMPQMDDEQAQPGTCVEKDGYCDANKVCGLGCPEVDLFEGSLYDMQVAIHACRGNHHKKPKQNLRRLDTSEKGDRQPKFMMSDTSTVNQEDMHESSPYYPSCDGEGCFSKMSSHAPRDSYGPGSHYTIDTTKPFKVSIYFRGYRPSSITKAETSNDENNIMSEDSSNNNVLMSVEVEVKQGDASVYLTIDDSECLRSFSAKHSIMKRNSNHLSSTLDNADHNHAISSGGWTRPQMLMHTLNNGQRLVSSLWGGGKSDFKNLITATTDPSSSSLLSDSESEESTFGCDHEVCVRRISLKNAIQQRDQKAVEIENLISEEEANEVAIENSPIKHELPVATVPIDNELPDTTLPIENAQPVVSKTDEEDLPTIIEPVENDLLPTVTQPEAKEPPSIKPVENELPPSIKPVENELPSSIKPVENELPLAIDSTVLKPLSEEHHHDHINHEKPKHPQGCFWSEQQKKTICPRDIDHNPQDNNNLETKQKEVEKEDTISSSPHLIKPIHPSKPCHWDNRLKRTVCPRDEQERHRNLLEFKLHHKEKEIQDNKEEVSLEYILKKSDLEVVVSKDKHDTDAYLNIDKAKKWLLARREEGNEEDDKLRRRLGCHYVAWKKQNVCDGPAGEVKKSSGPPPSSQKVAKQPSIEKRGGVPEITEGGSEESTLSYEESAKHQAIAAQKAAEEAALKNLTPAEPGHCCFSGDCNGCDSVAARHNFCSGSQNACEQDCEFVWCKGSEPPPPSSLSDNKNDPNDPNQLKLEPGRCCFFGDGCGEDCQSFAEEGNFCAISSDTCERQCGKHVQEFKWCPLKEEEEQEVVDTQICDPDTTSVTFSDLTISSYL